MQVTLSALYYQSAACNIVNQLILNRPISPTGSKAKQEKAQSDEEQQFESGTCNHAFLHTCMYISICTA